MYSNAAAADDGRQIGAPARRPELRKTFLFSTAATIAFFVTVETPVSPEADFKADFEPVTRIGMPQVALTAPKLPDRKSAAT